MVKFEIKENVNVTSTNARFCITSYYHIKIIHVENLLFISIAIGFKIFKVVAGFLTWIRCFMQLSLPIE